MSSHSPSSFRDLDNEVATRPNLDPKDDDPQGDDLVRDWLTIRRRCELCKQRKVWPSNNSASVDRSLHKDELSCQATRRHEVTSNDRSVLPESLARYSIAAVSTQTLH